MAGIQIFGETLKYFKDKRGLSYLQTFKKNMKFNVLLYLTRIGKYVLN
jgi:hypothetical protein